MQLGDRKKRILQAIIADYIETAEPVGSRTIAKKHMADLSSATIRNEMADLEELGYLQQPHTSSGRIPSDMGYRLYVDSLMERYSLTVMEMARVRESMDAHLREFDVLLSEAAALLSKLTNYTTLAMLPELKNGSLKSIQLVPIDQKRVMILLVTNEGIVKNRIIAVQDEISAYDALQFSNMLNHKLLGLTLEQINQSTIMALRKKAGNLSFLLSPVIDFVSEVISEVDKDVQVGGMSNILTFPEYATVEKARDILTFLDDKRQLHNIITPFSFDNHISVIIGNEHPILGNRHCSIVLCSCRVGQGFGKIGVIGPTRMDYPRVVSTLEYLAEQFNLAARRLFSDNDKGGDG